MSEINCRNCQGACCKGPTLMDLSVREYAFMLAGGNDLTPIVSPASHDQPDAIYPVGIDLERGTALLEEGNEYYPLLAGFGRFLLIGSCVYLETVDGWERCSVYENRPGVCKDFVVGAEKCRQMRMARGVDEPDEVFTRKLKLVEDR